MEELLHKYNQNKILDIYNSLDSDKKRMLEAELKKVDFEKISKMLSDIKAKTNSNILDIQPIDNVCVKENLSKEEKEKLQEIGIKEILNGHYAIVTMAGGQGTRLGHSGPKGTFMLDLPNGKKSIFEVLIDNLKEAYVKYNVYIPWYIMTSEENNIETIQFFESNNYFGYGKENIKFFVQGKLPMVELDGNIVLEDETKVKFASNGNGGIFEALIDSKILQDMKQKGIKWVYISGVDNILAKIVDEMFIGTMVNSKIQVGLKSVLKKSPEERVGVFCKKNNKPAVIEYIDLPDDLKFQRKKNGELLYSEANFVSNMFSIEFLDNLKNISLPYHGAIKKCESYGSDGKITEVDAYKFESFIFDILSYADDAYIFRVKREVEFAPIKNKEGEDSPDTAIPMYNKCKGK